jgi:hypothetical protein
MEDDVTDIVEVCRYHFVRHSRCSSTFWEEEHGNFVGDGLLHYGVMIGESCVATTINSNSTINLISIEVVEKFHLTTRARTMTYLLCSSYGTLLISHTANIPVTFGGHTEVVHCGVSPMPLTLVTFYWVILGSTPITLSLVMIGRQFLSSGIRRGVLCCV